MIWYSIYFYIKVNLSGGEGCTSQWTWLALVPVLVLVPVMVVQQVGCEPVGDVGWHQENSKPLEWLEPAPPVVLALQHAHWAYFDMPKSSTSAGGENVLVPAFKAGPSVAGTNEIVISLFAHYEKNKLLLDVMKYIVLQCEISGDLTYTTTLHVSQISRVYHVCCKYQNCHMLWPVQESYHPWLRR